MTRMKFEVVIPRDLVACIRSQAVESHPKEVQGYLLGHEVIKTGKRTVATTFDVRHHLVTVEYKIRTSRKVEEKKGNELDGIWDIIGTRQIERVGGWHSHPDGDPILSMPKDLSPKNRKDGVGSDFEAILDGQFEWICAAYPRKKTGRWVFRERAYARVGDRIYRCKINTY